MKENERKGKKRYEVIEHYLELNFQTGTRYQYRSHLTSFFKFIKADPNKYFSKTLEEYGEDVLRYNNHLKEKYSPVTITIHLSTIRNYFEDNGVEFRKKFWKDIRRRGKGNGKVVEDRIPTVTELQQILSYGDERDRAYFLMMCSTGMRESELSKIRIGDIDFESEPTMVKISPIIAKNKKRRITFLTHEASKAVQYWLNVREDYIKRNVEKFRKMKKYLEGKYNRQFEETSKDRVFPWLPHTSRNMWNRLLRKSGLTDKDATTDHYLMHLYVLRKFFETRLSSMLPEKYIKFMMGHSGYMGDPYFRPLESSDALEELKEIYKKGVTRITVFELPENQEAVDSIKSQMEDLQRQIRELTEFKEKVASVELRDEDGDTVIDDDGNMVYVPDPRIPEDVVKIAHDKEKELKFKKLVKTLGSEELARKVMDLED